MGSGTEVVMAGEVATLIVVVGVIATTTTSKDLGTSPMSKSRMKKGSKRSKSHNRKCTSGKVKKANHLQMFR